jgi:alpha-mannosidase
MHGFAPANPSGSLPTRFEFARVDADHVIIETLKKAELGEGYIVRVYEWKQRRSNRVRLAFGKPLARAVECNLVEEEEKAVEFDKNGLSFSILPFEIKTFKIWF